jgi:chemosensory pili system protein ChpA (sensor histidine kinase/response regulator)
MAKPGLPGVDPSALGIIAEETGRSLAQVAAALDRWEASRAEPAVLDDAVRALAQAHGALEVAGVSGLSRVVRELGALLADLAQGLPAHTDTTGLARYALDTVGRHLAGLTAESPPDVTALAQVLQRLLHARGVDRLAAVELFRPDLSRLPPDPVGSAAGTEDRRKLLQAARARFQKGLLSWLRLGDRNGLLLMRSAVESVDAACDSAAARAPWWVATGFLDLLVEGVLEPSLAVKRLCSALDQRLRRAIEGTSDLPEQLLREMLYYLATSPAATDRAAAVGRAYRIETTALPQPKERAVPFMRQYPPLRDLEQILEKAAQGDAAALKVFRDGVADAARQAPQDDRLAALLGEVARAADLVGTRTSDSRSRLAVETATTLLFLQDILSRWNAPDPDLHERIEAVTHRLNAACDGSLEPGFAGWSALFGAARRKAQDNALTGRLITELLSTLAHAEQSLNRYFEDSSAHAELAAAQSALEQSGGALEVAGEAAAAAAARHCATAIQRYRDRPGTGSAEEHARLAAVMSALHYYLEQLRFGRADLAGIMTRAGVPESTYSGAPVLPPTGDVAGGLLDRPADADATADHGWDLPADTDLLPVFIEEAQAVLEQVRTALNRLREGPDDGQALTSICRGFHTLKGSGRTVQLVHLSNAASQMERLVSDTLERSAIAGARLLDLIELALQRFGGWVAQLQSAGRVRVDADELITAAADLGAERLLERPAGRSAEPGELVAITSERSITIAGSSVSQTLFDVFLAEARQILDSLDLELEAARPGSSRGASHELFRLAHTLSGIAGTVRLDAIHHFAGALEFVVRQLHEGALSVTPDEHALLVHCASALRVMISQAAELSAPQPQGELQEQLEAMGRRLAQQATARRAAVVADASAAAQTATEFDPSTDRTVAFEIVGDTRQPAAASQDLPATPVVERRRERLADDVDARMLPVFLEEASDLVPRIGQALRAWRANPSEENAPQALGRLLHTLKGSARMAGAMALGELIHSTETRVLTAAQLALVPDSVFEALEASHDRIGLLLEGLSRPAHVGASQSAPAVESGENARAAAPAEQTAAEAVRAQGAPILPRDDDLNSRPVTRAGQITQAAAQGTQLRVNADLVERLAAEMGEVAITRSRLETEMRSMRSVLRDLAENIVRLRTQAREIEIQAESQMQSRQTVVQAPQGGMDPLEFDRFTRLQELTRFITEGTNDVSALQHNLMRRLESCDATLVSQARLTRTLQDAISGVRLVPFSTLSERLFRVARLAARDAGKRVNLDIRGGRVELDRGVLDRMVATLEHLLRNAVVHGIETAQVRRAAGKADIGEITLEVVQEGNEIVLSVRDDGAGFDIEGLRARAVDAGLLTAGAELPEREIAQLAFAPGVSTAQRVTEAAGRGLGLDVVRNEVAALGGRVEVAFERGKGTSFVLRLPLVVSVMQVLLIRCGGQLFAIPSAIVEQTRTMDLESLEGVRGTGHIEWRGRAYPHYSLRGLLGLPASAPPPRRRSSVVLVKTGSERAAVEVDELSAHQEVVVKSIGAQVARVAGIAGAAVLGSGEVVLILNPVRLVQRAAAPGAAHAVLPEPAIPAPPQAAATIMVIDDSVTMRRITSRVLSRHGYSVVEARDGVEALGKLQLARPDAVLLDIEMPRMDGFELLRRIRDDARWRDLPVMMITSRTADKHRQYARELGVEVFLGKPFEESDLIAQLTGLLAAVH